jgi:hypothetical protein
LNLFSGIADVAYLHTVTTNVSQSCYTTTHFLLLLINYVQTSCCNRPSTYLASNCCPPNNVEHRVILTSACLNFFRHYWLPSFPPSPGHLKRQVCCYMPAVAKRRLMQVTEQLGPASGHPIQFFGCRDRPSSGD